MPQRNLASDKHELLSLIDELQIGLYQYDLKGCSLFSNAIFQSLLGYSAEEIISKTVFELFSEKDSEVLIERVKANPPFSSKRLTGLTKDGHPIQMKILSYQHQQNDNITLKLLDITEQVETERVLGQTAKELNDVKYALEQSATVSVTDQNGDILYVNDKFCEISKYSRDELIGNNHRMIKSGFHPNEVYEDLWSTITKGKVWRSELCNKAKDGSIWWGGATIVPFLDDQGNPYQYIGIRSDITDRKRMEKEVEKANEVILLRERLFRSLVEHSHEIILLLDEKGVIQYVTPNVKSILSQPDKEVIGENIFNLVYDEDIEKASHALELILKEPEKIKKAEFRVLRKDLRCMYFDVIFNNLLHDPAVKAIKLNARDITENKMAEKKIHEISNYDSLTKLPNQKLFKILLNNELKEARGLNCSVALLLIELHGLKFVNDSLGTTVGDMLLIKVVQRLNEFVGKKGILSRLAGVEFMILYPITEKSQIHPISEEILHLFQQPFMVEGYELFINVTIGISFFPESGEREQELMKNAYAAVHQASDKGRNKYQIYSENMNIETYKRFHLKNDLQKAVNHQEFYIEYQPKIEMRTNKIIGAEALVRWEHPKWGIVAPDEFITLAEENSFISTLGKMVLQSACQQNKAWQIQGLPPIKVSVNFSPLQFLQSDLIQMVEEVLQQTALEPKWLEIEITENVLLNNESIVLDKLSILQSMGITIALDDFGTGYASLSYLKKLKADTIKMDRTFVAGIPDDSEGSNIVSAIIHLAQKLNIHTVVEGVENIEQLKYLRSINVDEIQGYLYSKPVSVERFTEMLRKEICLPTALSKGTEVDIENRRKFFRIDLKTPLPADMTIAMFNGKKVNLGSTKVEILDIGPGGIRIKTDIKLPIRKDLILKFSMNILGEQLGLSGIVVWKREVDFENNMYGIQFILNDKERKNVTPLLNRFQVKLRKSSTL